MKKAQVWLPDFLFGFLLFALALALSIKFVSNIFPDSGYKQLLSDAERISETFMSEGAPINWTNETVIKPGLLTDKKLDENKFRNLTNMSYQEVRGLFNTRYDFFIYIHNSTLPYRVLNDTFKFGDPLVTVNASGSVNLTELEYENLIKMDRFIVVNDSINFLVVFVWD
jgi:hypothetical protein